MLPTSPSGEAATVASTLHVFVPFEFCLYGVQLHSALAFSALEQLLPAARDAVLSPTTKITAEEAFICLFRFQITRTTI